MLVTHKKSLTAVTRRSQNSAPANRDSTRAPRRPNGSKKIRNNGLRSEIDLEIWTHKFIPTCIEILGISDKPFHFSHPDILEEVNLAFAICFPHLAWYTLKSDSIEYLVVCHVYLSHTFH